MLACLSEFCLEEVLLAGRVCQKMSQVLTRERVSRTASATVRLQHFAVQQQLSQIGRCSLAD